MVVAHCVAENFSAVPSSKMASHLWASRKGLQGWRAEDGELRKSLLGGWYTSRTAVSTMGGLREITPQGAGHGW